MDRTYSLQDLLTHTQAHGGITPEESQRLADYCRRKTNQAIWLEAIEYRFARKDGRPLPL